MAAKMLKYRALLVKRCCKVKASSLSLNATKVGLKSGQSDAISRLERHGGEG